MSLLHVTIGNRSYGASADVGRSIGSGGMEFEPHVTFGGSLQIKHCTIVGAYTRPHLGQIQPMFMALSLAVDLQKLLQQLKCSWLLRIPAVP